MNYGRRDMGVNVRKDTLAATTDAVSWAIDITGAYNLSRITLKCATLPTTTEDATVTIKRNEGSAYDVLLRTTDMSGVSNLTLEGLGPIHQDDYVLVEYPNTDGVSITGIATVMI